MNRVLGLGQKYDDDVLDPLKDLSAAVLENFSPSIKVFGIPYLFRDKEHVFDVLDGPVGKELLNGTEKFWLKGLGYYDSGSRSFYTIDQPLNKPEDLDGLKIRVQESQTAIDMVKSLGGSPTPISWGELYTALQQGVVDGAENNPPSFYLSRHYEVSSRPYPTRRKCGESRRSRTRLATSVHKT